MRWWQMVKRLFRAPPPRPPAVREHMPELHALRGRQTRAVLKTGLLERELAALRGEAEFDRRAREAGGDGD